MAKNNFFSDIKDWANTVEKEIAQDTAILTRTVFTMIIDRSPVASGRFMANWHIGPTDVNYSVNTTADWDAKIAELHRVIPLDYFLSHNTAYMVNNVFYAKRVEEDGWGDVGGRMAYAPVAKTFMKIGNGFAPVGQTLGAIAGGIV